MRWLAILLALLVPGADAAPPVASQATPTLPLVYDSTDAAGSNTPPAGLCGAVRGTFLGNDNSVWRCRADGQWHLMPTPVRTVNGAGPDTSGNITVPTQVGPQGPQGPKGDTGAASTVAGPQGPIGPTGAASTVAGPIGPQGATGAASTVPGPQGPIGPASTVAGPAGPQGLAGIVPVYGPAGLKASTYRCVEDTVTTTAGGAWTLPLTTAHFPGFIPFTAAPTHVVSQAISSTNLLAGLLFATQTAATTSAVSGEVALAGIGGLGAAGSSVFVEACGS